MTHTQAISILAAGNEELAWAVAQMDEGLNEGVTKAQWLVFAYRCIENQKAIDAAYEASVA